MLPRRGADGAGHSHTEVGYFNTGSSAGSSPTLSSAGQNRTIVQWLMSPGGRRVPPGHASSRGNHGFGPGPDGPDRGDERRRRSDGRQGRRERAAGAPRRSEEHTSELQSRQYLVCRLLLEKKKKEIIVIICLLFFI